VRKGEEAAAALLALLALALLALLAKKKGQRPDLREAQVWRSEGLRKQLQLVSCQLQQKGASVTGGDGGDGAGERRVSFFFY
jgi:hypothetical protein